MDAMKNPCPSCTSGKPFCDLYCPDYTNYHNHFAAMSTAPKVQLSNNNDDPKAALGLAKPPMSAIPPAALIYLGRAMADGKKKYGLMNWRKKSVNASIYYDAALRHLMAWWDGENTASDSGVHHLGHALACMSILLDAEATGNLNDDRPTPGAFAELVEAFTIKKEIL